MEVLVKNFSGSNNALTGILKQVFSNENFRKDFGIVKSFTNPRKKHLYLTFANAELQAKAIPLLAAFNTEWTVTEQSKPAKRGRRDKSNSSDNSSKQESENDSENSDSENNQTNPKKQKTLRTVEQAVTPLHHLGYSEQLHLKESKAVKELWLEFVKPLSSNWEKYLKENPNTNYENDYISSLRNCLQTYYRLKEKEEIIGQLPFAWNPIISSPKITGYRNNCEFSFGLDINREPCVGFLLGLYAEGFTDNNVGKATNCLNIPEEAKQVALLMEQFAKLHIEKYKIYMKKEHKGFWRAVKVRQNRDNHLLVMVQVNPNAAESETELNSILQQMVQYLLENKKDLQIKCIFAQHYSGISNSAPPDSKLEKLYGDDYIVETVSGVQFQISPVSFFQVNTLGAEVLYELARNWCSPSKVATLLDVCCGTGTIGLTSASQVSKVYGIDIVEQAIEDAKENARRNNIQNAEFVAGKAEDVLASVLQKVDMNREVAAIVDPPRAGLHKSVVNTLLHTQRIQRLVYVSCNLTSLIENALRLCAPPLKKHSPIPFRPIKAVAVDMFPHTEHCEMVIVFERIKQNSAKQE